MRSPIQRFLLKNLKNHPRNIVTFSALRLRKSRQVVHKHLVKLVNEGLVLRTGEKKASTYTLASAQHTLLKFHVSKNLNEDLIWKKHCIEKIKNLPSNVQRLKRGTEVQMQISTDSQKTLEEVFRRYTDSDTLRFEKTEILVELSKLKEESLISRSQAKRILEGLEKFRVIILDFKNIESVGQGFVDEIFRVYQNTHPQIEIQYIHTNQNVDFMIRRGLR